MEENYYIVLNGKQEGPFKKETLKDLNLTPDTLVWKPGIPSWVKLREFPELSDILIVSSPQPMAPPAPAPAPESIVEEREWFAMLDGSRQSGPHTIEELIQIGVNPNTPVWKQGMADWEIVTHRPEIMSRLNPNPQFSQPANPNPFDNTGGNDYGRQHGVPNQPPIQNPNQGYNNYGQPNQGYDPANNGYGGNQQPYGNPQQNPYMNQNPYNQPYGQSSPTNWLPWAIVATVVGFLFSCIGCIFGIIGIVQANKANNFFATNNYGEGERVNSNARTMTIIAFVLAGVGLLVGLFSGYSIFNYY